MALTPAFTLVTIRPDEADALLDACRRYWIELMPRWRGNADAEYRAAYFADRFRVGDPRNEHWWGVVDGARVGFARIEWHEDVDGAWASVHDFYVEANHRRHGYGTAMARAVVAAIKERGCFRVDLNVRADNPGALAFWQAAGFEMTSYRMRTYL